MRTLATMPRIAQLLLRRPESEDAERRAFRARRRAERLVRAIGAHEASGRAGLAGGAARFAATGATRAFLAGRALLLCRADEAGFGLRVVGIAVPLWIHQAGVPRP